jgi:photosystem II stability/assembly factor-like uncharacterized protein
LKRFAVLLVVVLATGAWGEEIFHGVALTPDASNTWIVTIETLAVYQSPNFGATWQPHTLLTMYDFFDVFFLSELRGWICGRVGQIWATSDGGASWNRQNLAGPKYASRIEFYDSLHGWSSGGEAIGLFTYDGGAVWQMFFVPDTLYPSDSIDFQGLAVPDTVHSWMAAGRWPQADSFVGGQGWLFKLTRVGDTVHCQFQRKDTYYDYFDVAFTDTLNGWVVGGMDTTFEPHVIHTTNGGADWVEQSVPAQARLLRAVHFVSPTEGWACGRSGTIIHTTDAGTTWDLQVSGVDTTLFDIDFAGNQMGMAVGAGGTVLRTKDGGQTWERCYSAVAEPGESPKMEPRLLSVSNPSRGIARMSVRGVSGAFTVTVYDAAGSLVRRFDNSSLANRQLSLAWDGRDGAGRPVQTGLYLARLFAGDKTETCRFVLLRE